MKLVRRPRARLDADDAPDRVHGRLSEALHLSGYTFARACDELKWLLRQDRWKRVSPGYDDIDTFLGTIDFSDLRAARDQRKDLVKQLEAIKAGQRATARLLGVDPGTVRGDLGLKGEENSSPNVSENTTTTADPTKTLSISEENSSSPQANRLHSYYSDAGITIYHGDCREILPSLPRGLMVTDPPYNVGYHYDKYHDALDPKAYDEFLGSVLTMPLVVIHYPEAIFPLARRWVRTPDELVAWVYHSMNPKQWRAVAWFGISPDFSLSGQDYKNPTDKRIAAQIEKGHQAALYDWWHIEQVKNVSTEKTEHPCQIPKALMMRVLHITPFDGLIIDPFCGSGTTLLAAQELGRPAIGIESSETYCEAARLRLRQRTLDLEMTS